MRESNMKGEEKHTRETAGKHMHVRGVLKTKQKNEFPKSEHWKDTSEFVSATWEGQGKSSNRNNENERTVKLTTAKGGLQASLFW